MTNEILERKLTNRQRRFTKELIEDPTSPAEAAIRAGYSPRSAHVIASRLLRNERIQSELAQHFADQELEIAEALKIGVARLKTIITEGKPKTFFQAFRQLLEYTKLATSVLGLQVRIKPEAEAALPEGTSLESLIEQHRKELARLEVLNAERVASLSAEAGDRTVQ